jgi:hypothetical protein
MKVKAHQMDNKFYTIGNHLADILASSAIEGVWCAPTVKVAEAQRKCLTHQNTAYIERPNKQKKSRNQQDQVQEAERKTRIDFPSQIHQIKQITTR